MDYTKTSSYADAIKRAEANRAIQKETNTDIARRNLRRSGGAILGSIGGLAAGIRNNLLNPDPSLASAVGTITGAYSNINNLMSQLNSGGGKKAMQIPMRKLPLRSVFQDNKDEFIGGNSYLNSKKLGSPLSLSEYWQKMDAAADNSMIGVLDDPTKIFDIMGRSGRAIDEMRQRGSVNSYFRASTGKKSAGSGPRSVPFGMMSGKEA